MYKTVLFDLDGTLTDPYEGITKSVAYALRHYGIEVSDRRELTCFIGPPLANSFMKYYGFDEKRSYEAIDVYREYFSVTGIFENEMYDGVSDMLARLKSTGAIVALATSKPTIFARRILDHFDIARYFDCIVGSELDGKRVDKADVISAVIDETNCAKDSAIMVGDRMHDVVGAAKNGIPCVGVTYGYGSREELVCAGARIICDSVTELKKTLLIQ